MDLPPMSDLPQLRTSINGEFCRWPIEVWRLWYTHVDQADPKLYDTHGIATDANYWTPRPYVDQYNRGDVREGFTFTIANRHVYQQTIATHTVGSDAWHRLMDLRAK